MSALPKIGSGQLVLNSDVRRSSEVRSTLDFDITHGRESHRNSSKHRPSSFVSLNESLPSVHSSRDSQRRKLRSRSLDPAAVDENERNAKKRRENENRSKSHDPHNKNPVRSVRSIQSPLSESDEYEYENDFDIDEEESEAGNGRKVRFNEGPVVSDVVKRNDLNKTVNPNRHTVADVKHHNNEKSAGDRNNEIFKTISPINTQWPESPDAKKARTSIFHAKQNNKISENSNRTEVKVNNKNKLNDNRQWNKINRNSPKNEAVQVYSKKYQTKNWTETYSDPGPDNTRNTRR